MLLIYQRGHRKPGRYKRSSPEGKDTSVQNIDFVHRIEKVRARMEAQGLDVLVATKLGSRHYLAGVFQSTLPAVKVDSTKGTSRAAKRSVERSGGWFWNHEMTNPLLSSASVKAGAISGLSAFLLKTNDSTFTSLEKPVPARRRSCAI